MIDVDRSLGDKRVISVLDRLRDLRPQPDTITTDNGPEFIGKATDTWSCRTGVKLHFIGLRQTRGERVRRESLIGELRHECLICNRFLSLTDGKEIIEAESKDCNSARPHSPLGGLTPRERAETPAGLQLAPVSPAGARSAHSVKLTIIRSKSSDAGLRADGIKSLWQIRHRTRCLLNAKWIPPKYNGTADKWQDFHRGKVPAQIPVGTLAPVQPRPPALSVEW